MTRSKNCSASASSPCCSATIPRRRSASPSASPARCHSSQSAASARRASPASSPRSAANASSSVIAIRPACVARAPKARWAPEMLTPDELAALMAGDTPHALLDLREKGAYERGHVFRATSLPRRLLEWGLPALVPARATPIVLCDADGRLAELAAPTLRELGYTNVDALAGGLAAWRSAGRPLVEGLNVPSKVFGERMLHELATPEIAPRDLLRRLERGDDLVIVDARTVEEYARGCVPGAISVPGGELVLRIGDLAPRPETTIVVHCGGRTRSYIGAESLRRMRLPNPIVALENGTMGWELAGLTLERGATRTAPAPGSRSHGQAAATAKRVAVEDGVRFLGVDDVRRLWDGRR